ncbi:transposase [Streptomyces malaysiensis]|uniref:transposase n=1 Tax=Streptomyces malaysiensis TaxID=92644 RepID=UPI003556E7ED
MRGEVTAGQMGLTRGDQTMPAPRKYPLELRDRAVRMYRAAEPKPVIRRMAEELGVHHEALRTWIRQAEADARRAGGPADHRGEGRARPAAARGAGTAPGQ